MNGAAWLNDDLPLPDGPMGVTHRLSPLNLRFRIVRRPSERERMVADLRTARRMATFGPD